MVERLDDMAPGTLGFRVSGKLDRHAYHELLAPVRAALASGERVRLLIATAPDFQGLDLGAVWEDAKVGGDAVLRHRGSWERIAVVTDKDWLRHAISGFGWLSPGELQVFEPHELDAAKTWVAATG
jgi:hypothetical protein